ncbi:uncharacterized protein LOC134231784 [Saccostrea cucullata]|uniref:uncharacterized protein LOC134231784 n=1 Tax=Saccostrea cuccullata TaxID=36930 RepID=UPI002ED02894
MVMETFAFLQAIAVFVFLAHSMNKYVISQINIRVGFQFPHHGPYQIGDTFRGICDVELPPDENITNVDAYWKVGNTDYCYNGQKIWLNMNYTCGAITVQNTTYFELQVPDLTLEDTGTYACKVKYTTKGLENTDSQNITVIDPSITKPRKTAESTTVTTLTGSDGRGGAVSVETKLLSTIVIMLLLSLVYV